MSRSVPVASVKRIRYSVNVGASSATSTPSSIQLRSVSAAPLVPVGPSDSRGTSTWVMLCDVAGAERVEVGVGQHVVRRGDEIVDDAIAVAEGGERREPGHGPTMPPPAARNCNDLERDDLARSCVTSTASCGSPISPIAGATEAIAALQAAGRRVLFVTNNSAATVATQEAALAAIGVDATGSVVSSAMAAALLVEPGERVLVAGGPGLVEAMDGRGVDVVVNDGTLDAAAIDADPFAAVVTGLHRDFDYARLRERRPRHPSRGSTDRHERRPHRTRRRTDSIPAGDRSSPPSPRRVSSSRSSAGKPYRPMADLIRSLLATEAAPYDPASVIMVGDRLDTDGSFAGELGCRFALVCSGSIAPGADVPGLPAGSLTWPTWRPSPESCSARRSERNLCRGGGVGPATRL